MRRKHIVLTIERLRKNYLLQVRQAKKETPYLSKKRGAKTVKPKRKSIQ